MTKELTAKELSSLGGKARFKAMTDKEKSALGKRAAAVRWGKRGIGAKMGKDQRNEAEGACSSDRKK